MTASVLSFIQANPTLRDADAATQKDLAAAARLRRLTARQILFQHGDDAHFVYFILRGRVSICLQTTDGRQLALNIVEHGQVVGDIAVLDGQPRSASAVALSDCTIAVVARADFLRLIARDGQLATSVIRRLCHELRRVSERVAAAGLLDVQAGLAHRLLERARSSPVRTAGGVDVDVSQEELAHSVGVSRVTANKYLNAWRHSGWVSLSRGRVKLLDELSLARLIERQFDGARLES